MTELRTTPFDQYFMGLDLRTTPIEQYFLGFLTFTDFLKCVGLDQHFGTHRGLKIAIFAGQLI